MKVRIFELPAFSVVGQKKTMEMSQQTVISEIDSFWQEAEKKEGLISILENVNDGSTRGLFGISHSVKTTQEHPYFDYWIAVDSTHTETFSRLDIPAAKWAAFEVIGPPKEKMKITLEQILSTELALKGLTMALPYQVEYYIPNQQSTNKIINEIWIPIR